MKKHKKRQKGIALMIVLATIALLTSMVVEFAYNSHIAATMAHNDLDRLRAYYLARSALNFARLQVKIEKDVRSQLSKYAKYLEGVVGSEPICTLMPFSTDLLRGYTTQAAQAESGTGETESGEEGKGLEFESIMAAAAAGDFLNFDGDFSVSCRVEDSKMNINYFRELDPEAALTENEQINDYEYHKRLLESLLASPAYDEFFENSPEKRRELVNNIADWVDKNNLVDEQPGFQAGYEDQVYADDDYTVKNGKYSTPDELMLVEGMEEGIYNQLYPDITIYGDDKINLCLSDDEMIKAFVIRYSNSSQEMNPILPDNEELLNEILTAVHEACLTPLPKPNEVANAIRGVLGLDPEAAAAPAQKKKSAKGEGEQGQEGKEDETGGEQEEEKPPALKTLTEQIETENRFYSFDLTGSSGDIILKIRAVINAEGDDPEKWPMLYYKVQ